MTSIETRLPVRFRDAALALQKRWRWIVFSAVVCGAMGLAYAATRKPVWESSQATVLRDEAIGELTRQGRFESADALKTAQETVLQVARQRETAAAALAEVGPPPAYFRLEAYPNDGEVDAFLEEVTVAAPKGLEFGKSEVMYVTAQAPNAVRASKLVASLCERIDLHLRQLRRERASEVIAEMTKTVELAQAELKQATGKLHDVEQKVGSDLGELRVLNESGGGESNLRTTLNQIRAEVRQLESDRTAKEELRKILEAAKAEPERFVATPNRLLEAQPALRRLKDGLVDAQLRRAALVGKLNPEHPELLSAIAAESETKRNVLRELDGAMLGLDDEIRVVQASLDDLLRQQKDVDDRLGRLAGMRADYGNLVAIVKQRSEALQLADKKLSDAKASYEAAGSARLLTTMGPPVPSDGPVGPGKMQIVLAAGLLGAFGCAGAIMLATPLQRMRGRRVTDYLPPHLRPVDRNTGRRDIDRIADPAQLAVLSQAPPTVIPPATPRGEEAPASRSRRASDIPEAYAGPDRRVAERRQSTVGLPAIDAAEESLAPGAAPPESPAEPTESAADPADSEPSLDGSLDRNDEHEEEGGSPMVGNLRRQIDLLRQSTVRFEGFGESHR
ncbi:MAG TPA: Wzz/FepE/Etk N-terminal domain-containing protein [Pirellulaceae bacterium]|jgi:uncharacterized protein involved in exopolysaccharide biosynthesis|nr:Wzz/FepE/Etk N-terminal domain-containing protein [Pirellulaceae bacterium]